MTLQIDTETIRRLRDALIAGGRLDEPNEIPASDTSRGRRKASVGRVAPFVETMYLMMIADGHSLESEREAILGALSMLTHGFLDQSDLAGILSDSEAEAQRQGVEARLQAIGAQISASRQDREIAFTLAAAVAIADDEIAGQEHSLIESIAEWYGLSTRRCNEILQQLESRAAGA
jgi:tellurite resistance protein